MSTFDTIQPPADLPERDATWQTLPDGTLARGGVALPPGPGQDRTARELDWWRAYLQAHPLTGGAAWAAMQREDVTDGADAVQGLREAGEPSRPELPVERALPDLPDGEADADVPLHADADAAGGVPRGRGALGGAAGATDPVEPTAAGDLAGLAGRLAAVARGWTLSQDAEGYVLTPPDGDWARITTRAALETWLSKHEARDLPDDVDEDAPRQMELFDVAA